MKGKQKRPRQPQRGGAAPGKARKPGEMEKFLRLVFYHFKQT